MTMVRDLRLPCCFLGIGSDGRCFLVWHMRTHRWSILKFLYETFDECQRVLSVNEMMSRMCSDGEIHIEGLTMPWQIDGDGYAFS